MRSASVYYWFLILGFASHSFAGEIGAEDSPSGNLKKISESFSTWEPLPNKEGLPFSIQYPRSLQTGNVVKSALRGPSAEAKVKALQNLGPYLSDDDRSNALQKAIDTNVSEMSKKKDDRRLLPIAEFSPFVDHVDGGLKTTVDTAKAKYMKAAISLEENIEDSKEKARANEADEAMNRLKMLMKLPGPALYASLSDSFQDVFLKEKPAKEVKRRNLQGWLDQLSKARARDRTFSFVENCGASRLYIVRRLSEEEAKSSIAARLDRRGGGGYNNLHQGFEYIPLKMMNPAQCKAEAQKLAIALALQHSGTANISVTSTVQKLPDAGGLQADSYYAFNISPWKKVALPQAEAASIYDRPAKAPSEQAGRWQSPSKSSRGYETSGAGLTVEKE